MKRAKKLFYQIRDQQGEVHELTLRIDKLKADAEGVSSIDYSRDKVQTSPKPDAMGDKIISMICYEDELARKLEKLNSQRHFVQKIINGLESSKERQVLDLYFLSDDRPSMGQVADRIGYTERQTFRIYDSALNHAEVILNQLRKKCQ